MPDIEDKLEANNATYGEYYRSASKAQIIKAVFMESESYLKMNAVMRESLDMIATKLARILEGDPFYKDSWIDIEGYAKLVSNSIPNIKKKK